MKILYKDNALIIDIITEASPAYESLTDSNYVEIVANNVSASVGQVKEDGEPAQDCTSEIMMNRYGSQRSLTKDYITQRLGDDLTSALEGADQSVIDYWNGIQAFDEVVLDETCLILPLIDDMVKYDRIGVTSVASIKSTAHELLEALEAAATTTTTEAPAE